MLPKKLAFLLLWLFPAAAALGQESWHLLLLNGQEAGYVHTVVKELDTDPPTCETSQETLFRMKRIGTKIEIAETTTTMESAAGQIVSLKKASQMSNSETLYEGVVQGDELRFTACAGDKPIPSSIDWPEDMPGPREQERRLARTGFEPGASISMSQFDFTLGDPFESTQTVQGDEDVELPGGVRRLHKILTIPDLAGMPETTSWVDDDGSMVKSSTSMMGLQIETVLSDAKTVDRLVGQEDTAVAEVFMQSTITANIRLPRPRSLSSILSRVRLKQQDKDLPDLNDERQTILERDPDQKQALLRISVQLPPADRKQKRPLEDPDQGLLEYLQPNALLQSDNPLLVKLALDAVRDETDAWTAAKKLERVVYETIDKKSMDVAFASALEVCQTKQGDCSEHAVLLAALLRSAGIPSRIAMGVVYVGGIFGGHAWTEASIDGRWYALDATIGRGGVDPTHVRMGTSSLKDGGFSKGMLGVLQGLGMIDLEILEFTQGDTVTRVDGKQSGASVEDGVFVDRHEGVSFKVPAGWTAHPGDPEILEMSNRFVLAELTNPGSTATLKVITLQVPYDFKLEDVVKRWKQQAEGAPVSSIKRRMSGLDGLEGSFEKEGRRSRAAAVLLDDSVYLVEVTPEDDAAFEAFHAVIGSLRIE
ncbi:MAG: transglutaminase-like domain-containing protein [Planctomycetota bacterium]